MQGDVPAEVRMTDLLGRLEAHACLHDELCRHDPEQTAFAADLRAAKAEIERLRAVLAQLREYTDALNKRCIDDAAEIGRLQDLTYCACGDQFTADTPGTCYGCCASMQGMQHGA